MFKFLGTPRQQLNAWASIYGMKRKWWGLETNAALRRRMTAMLDDRVKLSQRRPTPAEMAQFRCAMPQCTCWLFLDPWVFTSKAQRDDHARTLGWRVSNGVSWCPDHQGWL